MDRHPASHDDHELRAFRFSETLTCGVYAVTDRWPPEADAELTSSLRQITPTISGCVLDGCARQGAAAVASWRTAARLLERLADALDRAESLGLLDPDSCLGLLEAQSGALFEVLTLAQREALGGPSAPACQGGDAELPLAA